MKGVKPIMKMKKWKTVDDMIEFCNHVISHRKSYNPERVFEARELINNYNNL